MHVAGDQNQIQAPGDHEPLPTSDSLDQDFSESSSPEAENSSASYDDSGFNNAEGAESRTDLDSLSEQSKTFYNSHQLSEASRPKQEISYTAAGKERKRRQILPKIAKEDRCGTCHHCMNPKLKKACITARKMQMKSLDEQEELPLFYKIASNKVNSKAAPLTKPKAPPSNDIRVTTEQIQGLLVQVDNQVTIKPGKQQHFLDLLSKPQEGWGTRIFFMTVVSMLPLADRTMLVKHSDFKGLHVLHNWLNKARETANAEKFQLDVLAALGALPVDMEALRKVPIGKTANGLAKKDPSAKVRSAAAAVVQQWRRNVGMPDADVKRARSISNCHAFPMLYSTPSVLLPCSAWLGKGAALTIQPQECSLCSRKAYLTQLAVVAPKFHSPVDILARACSVSRLSCHHCCRGSHTAMHKAKPDSLKL